MALGNVVFHKILSSKQLLRTFALKEHNYAIKWLNEYDRRCFYYSRMKRATFLRFDESLKSKTNLKTSSYFTIQEKLVIFY